MGCWYYSSDVPCDSGERFLTRDVALLTSRKVFCGLDLVDSQQQQRGDGKSGIHKSKGPAGAGGQSGAFHRVCLRARCLSRAVRRGASLQLPSGAHTMSSTVRWAVLTRCVSPCGRCVVRAVIRSKMSMRERVFVELDRAIADEFANYLVTEDVARAKKEKEVRPFLARVFLA